MTGLTCALLAVAAGSTYVRADVLPYDHIVIVIEENRRFDEIIGSPNAPYINNTLVAQGVSFNNFFALTHPSQPNYIQFFSGGNQGVTNNSLPAAVPFTTPNLGASIRAAGVTFAGYSEDLPSTDILADSTIPGGYRRKHNPWVNWQDDGPGASPHALPSTVNRAFNSATFPTAPGTDYSFLPTVSIVIPTDNHNMHDGTVAQGDAWLADNLDAYYQWARSHNSLLIVTFDEDPGDGPPNRIPTVFAGANLQAGVNDATWTLHNLQRTLTDMYSAAPSGSAADVRAIHGAFAGDAPATTLRFREGDNGYAGTQDTSIEPANPNTPHGGEATPVVVDGSPVSQGLIRFDAVIGTGANQVPPGASILSAKLIITTNTAGDAASANDVRLHRMLTPWSELSTWNSLLDGVSADDVDATATPDFTLLPNVTGVPTLFDVSDTLQLWADGETNFGWALAPTGTDGWRWNPSESANLLLRPVLEVTFLVPEPGSAAAFAMVFGWMLLGRGRRRARHGAGCTSRRSISSPRCASV